MSDTIPAGVQAELNRVTNPHTRQVLAYLAGRAGIRGAAGLTYLVARMRWHLGNRKIPPIAKSLGHAETAHVERRAGELILEHHHLLPPIVNEPPAGEPAVDVPPGAGIPTEPAPLPANVVPIAAARQPRPLRPGGSAA